MGCIACCILGRYNSCKHNRVYRWFRQTGKCMLVEGDFIECMTVGRLLFPMRMPVLLPVRLIMIMRTVRTRFPVYRADHPAVVVMRNHAVCRNHCETQQ